MPVQCCDIAEMADDDLALYLHLFVSSEKDDLHDSRRGIWSEFCRVV